MEGLFTCPGNYWSDHNGQYIYYQTVRLVVPIGDYPTGFQYDFVQYDTLKHEVTFANHDPENGLDMDVMVIKVTYKFSVKHPL